MANRTSAGELAARARALLDEIWKESLSVALPLALDAAILESIEAVVNSSTKTYRYVLPTQLLAKLADPSLDCRCVQERSSSRGAFDARSLCAQVVVPFDRQHHNVLGGTADPYVNNPMRIPRIDRRALAAQRNQADFARLIGLLDRAEDSPELARPMLVTVCQAIRKRLDRTQFVYAVPNRSSVTWTQGIMEQLLSVRSGGVRLQCVSVALFRAIGARFMLFDRVEARRINAADAASGDAADLACLDAEGRTVLAVEVKDRALAIGDIESKLDTLRTQSITELMFAFRGEEQPDAAIGRRIAEEFTAGHNIYRIEFDAFASAILPLLGESGRKQFLTLVGEALDEFADLADREAWRALLLTSQA